MIDDYRDLLTRWPAMHPDDQRMCAVLHASEMLELQNDLPRVDLCVDDDNIHDYLLQLIEQGGHRAVQRALHEAMAANMADVVAVKVCEVGRPPRVSRANPVSLSRIDKKGHALEQLGRWGEVRPWAGTTWWRMEAHGKRGAVVVRIWLRR